MNKLFAVIIGFDLHFRAKRFRPKYTAAKGSDIGAAAGRFQDFSRLARRNSRRFELVYYEERIGRFIR